MATPAEQVERRLKNDFPDLSITFGAAVLECQPQDLPERCRRLKDDFGFRLLVDLCGVDYAAFGKQNWETNEATAEGFSRGVFDFDNEGDNLDLDPSMPGRYCVVYQLLDVERNQRLRLKCYAQSNDIPVIPSVVAVWQCADWYEREAFDLFGILFDGHPDLRRILTDYGFIGHPLRKDFPLTGKVEMYYDPRENRVRYRPVTITNRVNVPRVIREDYGG